MISWKEEFRIWRWWALFCLPTIMMALFLQESYALTLVYGWSAFLARFAARYWIAYFDGESNSPDSSEPPVMASIKCDDTSSIRLKINGKLIAIDGGKLHD